MSNVIPFRSSTRAPGDTIICDDAYGGCPSCGRNDGYFNDGPMHYFYCAKHRTKWLVGRNLFDSWRRESEEERSQERRHFSGYKDVNPIPFGTWPRDPVLRDTEIQRRRTQRERDE
jgi:hypothetical protein